MEDPSIRTHDAVFEQLLWFGFGFVVLIIVAICVMVYLHNRDRRY